MDGILGLAFQSLSDDKKVPPFIKAWKDGLVDQPLFTVFMAHRSNFEDVGGMFPYGALDTENCGDIVAWEPLTEADYWSIKLRGYVKTTKYPIHNILASE